MVIALIKMGLRVGRLISVAYSVLGTALVVVQVVQILGGGTAEAKEKRVRKTRKPKQVARED
jgi:hypothetical protein